MEIIFIVRRTVYLPLGHIDLVCFLQTRPTHYLIMVFTIALAAYLAHGGTNTFVWIFSSASIALFFLRTLWLRTGCIVILFTTSHLKFTNRHVCVYNNHVILMCNSLYIVTCLCLSTLQLAVPSSGRGKPSLWG
jgi:hypothetical protein